jgi:hypothetical protein
MANKYIVLVFSSSFGDSAFIWNAFVERLSSLALARPLV